MYKSARIYQYTLDFKSPVSFKGCVLSQRKGLVLELVDGSNNNSYGECAPLSGFSRETLDDALSQLSASVQKQLKKEPVDKKGLFPSVAFALESALGYQRAVLSENKASGEQKPEVAPLLTGDRQSIVKRLKKWSGDWPAEFKLKVGRSCLTTDIKQVHEVLNCLPDEVRLRLDANQGWDTGQACCFGCKIPVNRITYIEEPTRDYRQFGLIYQQTGLGFALDETIQQPDYQFEPLSGLRAIVIKPTLVGGILRCEELVQQALANGVRAVFSSSFESGIGIGLIERLSKALTPEEAPGLDTLSSFTIPLSTRLPDTKNEIPQAMELKWIYNSPH